MKKDILNIENLATFEKLINRDPTPYDINLMVMPGTLQEKHKNVDPEKGNSSLRRQFNLVFLFLEGVHDLQLGVDYHWLKPDDLVIVPENTVTASPHLRNCIGYCIHFKPEFLQPLLNGPISGQFPFFDPEAEHIINLSPDDSKLVQQSFRDIIREYDRFSYEKDYLLRNYIHILLLRIREIYRPYINNLSTTLSGRMKLANRFKRLVEKNFMAVREVSRYARMLNISPGHLSQVVKSETGLSPRKIINNMLLLESKVLLGSTNKNISEIAHLLRFEDQAHFHHFIRQQSGLTPSELRKKL
jgi:AraC-like DNA-binding protein